MNDVLLWMEASALGQLMRDSTWLFPTAEILHFMGLSMLMGSLMVVDFRLLGFTRHISFQAAYKFLPLSLIGFGINLVTGIMFCFTDPFRYYPNLAFRLKMFLILLAGLNALWFQMTIHPRTTGAAGIDGAGKTAKIIAALSLLIWVGVIVLGRFIPYLEE